MAAPRRYWEELGSELSAKPTWFPTDGMELGAFGTISGGRFVTAGRLADFDIPLVASPPPAGKPFKKQRGMKIGFSAGATAAANVVDAALGVSIESTSESGWVFAATGLAKTEIQNILEVNRLVLEARKRGDWKREYLLVTAVWRAEHLTVLVANGKSKVAKAHAKGTVADPVDALVEAGAKFEYATDDFFVVPNAPDTTPLYALHALRGLFDPTLKPISSGDLPRGAPDEELLPLDDVPYDSPSV